jgi:hypothetical protein
LNRKTTRKGQIPFPVSKRIILKKSGRPGIGTLPSPSNLIRPEIVSFFIEGRQDENVAWNAG